MRRFVIAAFVTALLAAGCSSNPATPAADTATTTTPSPQDSGMVAPGQQMPSPTPPAAQVSACRVLAAMRYDITTTDAASTTQDQINAAMNLLPSGDQLGKDILAAEEQLVNADIDWVGAANNAAGYRDKYDGDVRGLENDLHIVVSDCTNAGVPFSIDLQHR